MRLLFALLALQTAHVPTLADVKALSPQAAGRLLLPAGHEPIVSARELNEPSMRPPGLTEYELIDAPQPVPGGCVRHRWVANFQNSPGASGGDPSFAGASAKPEVSLIGPAGCPDTGYAVLNGGLEPSQAASLLRLMADISSGRRPARLTCVSEMDPAFCGSASATRAGLQAIRPWAVMQRAGVAEMWLGERGKMVTIVRLRPEQPDDVSVQRIIPAPF